MTDPGADRVRFSILLPTHDRADVIGYAIRSALQQTCGDFEILLVCDGCSAEAAAAVRAIDDERIRLFDLPKAPGHGWANRNTALQEARGELVAFLGDDDLLFPDHLALFDEIFRDERVEWAYSRPLWMTDDGVLSPVAVDLRRPQELERFMTAGNSIPPSCVVHRRSALDRYGYWPHELWRGDQSSSIDWELWKRMVGPAQGSNLDYLPVPTSIHFRARWRDPDDWTTAGLRPWLERARQEWWPPALLVPVSEAETPQAAAWEWLRAEHGQWPATVRAAVVSVVDGYAWEAVGSQARVAALEADVAILHTQVGDLDEALNVQTARAERLRAALSRQQALQQTILGSHSWSATRPLRAVGRWLRHRRPGYKG